MPLYAVAILLSSFLLFLVQPIIARILLPWFGGSAAVWTTCMLFFQTGLLAGYFHGYWTHRLLRPRARAALHAALLALSLLLLPIVPEAAWRPLGGASPSGPLLLLLARCVGLPYVLLSATGPLFQDWFAARFPGRDPYRLFSWSNLASLLGLLSYPFAIEPHLSSLEQARLWGWGYRAFVLLGIAAAVDSLRAPVPVDQSAPLAAPVPGDSVPLSAPPQSRLLWLLLPAGATTLLLSVTNFLTQDVAAIPLLWVLPLGLYLLTFTLCFARRSLYVRPLFLPVAIVGLVALAILRAKETKVPVWGAVPLWCAGVFVVCMVLHGELSRRRPPAASLTEYYLFLSLGGALGGLLVGIGAPLLLPANFEVEISLLLCGGLILAALWRELARPFLRPAGALWLAGLAAANVASVRELVKNRDLLVRGFYGSLSVFDDGPLTATDTVRRLLHGSINHGAQWTHPSRSKEPLTYYCPDSGVGMALSKPPDGKARKVGVIGLGTGTLAAYGRAGDRFRFYDIDPLVERIARTRFTYLKESAAAIEVVLGDARLSLEAEPPQGYDLLAVDAFSGDAIPVHLLTREAIALYLHHLAPQGVLAIHVSNRHVNLEPVVAEAALALGRTALTIVGEDNSDEAGKFCFGNTWVMVLPAGSSSDPAYGKESAPAERLAGFRGWTDDYSSLVAVLERD